MIKMAKLATLKWQNVEKHSVSYKSQNRSVGRENKKTKIWKNAFWPGRGAKNGTIRHMQKYTFEAMCAVVGPQI